MLTFLNKFSGLLTTKSVTLIILVIGILIYGSSLANPFIADDIPQIINNPFVHNFQFIPNLFSGSTFYSVHANGSVGIYYRPLMLILFNLIYGIFGPNPIPFHLLQLLLHIGSAIMLFLLLKRFFTQGISFLLAAFFIIHPINSEAVLYISDLQDVLFVFFGLAATLLLLSSNINYRKLLAGGILLFLSLMSKETGFLFILINLFYIYLFNKKLLKIVTLGSLTLIVLYLLFRVGLAHVYLNHQEVSPIVKLSTPIRLLNIPAIINHYLVTLIFPRYLALSQQWVIRSISLNSFVIPLFVLCLGTFAAVFFGIKLPKQQQTVYLFFSAWLILGMLIISQIYPLDMTVAERWFYFPFIGLLGMVGVAVQRYRGTLVKHITFFAVLLLIIFIALGMRTITRSADWKDALILYSHDVRINKDSYTLENEFGYELAMRERYDEAEQHFFKSTQLAPDWSTNWSNLGVLYFKKGNIKKAEQYLKTAVENGDDNAYGFLATIYIFYDKNYQIAEEFLLSSLRTYPQSSLLWQQLALAEYGLGNKPKAIEAANNAYSLSPDQKNYNLLYNLTNNIPIDLNPIKSFTN